VRRVVDRVATALGWAAGLVACALLVAIVASVLMRGGGALSLDFVLESTRAAGAAGGVADQILGTLLLVATAALVAAPSATALALAAGVHLSDARSRGLRRALYVMNGLPTIVLGVFGMLVFVELFGWGKSWLAGGLVLGAMIVPTVAFARLERIDAIPRERIEAAAGLGLSLAARVRSVILPESRGGMLSGLLLGLARAAGETAPILFTAVVFSGAGWPDGVRESPVLALPYHIFVLAQDSYDPAAITNLWGAAAVLLALVLGTSLLALPARLRAHEESRHG
jgi:phosphate transport system permease protein